ncbi:MAG: hypothetical protein ACRD16_02935 [Thermoanaerobaculia bacterium]
MSERRDSPARRAITRYFREPPAHTPDDLGIVFGHAGKGVFLPAEAVVEIAPALPSSALPGAPGFGVAFWRGRALEVRGIGNAAESFVLVRGAKTDFFLVAETRPVAISRALASDVESYRDDK